MMEKSKHRKIKVLFLDIDGVLTNGTKFYHSDGTISKQFYDHDSAGLKFLVQEYKVQIFLVSEDQRINKKWAKHQGLPFYHSKDKLTTVKRILKKIEIRPQQAAFIGDDQRDLEAMSYVGYPISPTNASQEIKKLCKANPVGILLKLGGGKGAVREAVHKIISLNKRKLN